MAILAKISTEPGMSAHRLEEDWRKSYTARLRGGLPLPLTARVPGAQPARQALIAAGIAGGAAPHT